MRGENPSQTRVVEKPIMFWSRFIRPNKENWKAHANLSSGDDEDCYIEAAAKAGVKIKFGYPVPCPADADYAARLGMKGVYVNREGLTKEKENAFRSAFSNAKMNLLAHR